MKSYEPWLSLSKYDMRVVLVMLYPTFMILKKSIILNLKKCLVLSVSTFSSFLKILRICYYDFDTQYTGKTLVKILFLFTLLHRASCILVWIRVSDISSYMSPMLNTIPRSP